MRRPAAIRATADPTKLPLLTKEDAGILFRKPQLLTDCCDAGWLKPCVSRSALTLYDRRDVEKCIARILAGELPPRRKPAGA